MKSQYTQQLEKAGSQIASLQLFLEEKEIGLKSNKEMIQGLQSRLMEVEPELDSLKEKLKSRENDSHASSVLKVSSSLISPSLLLLLLS